MRLITIGDPHITSGPRFERTVGVLRWCLDTIRELRPDAIAIMGDHTGTHDVPHVATVAERGESEALHLACAEIAPTISLRGNHDDPADFAQLANLKHPNLHVVAGPHPEVLMLAAASVVAVPYPHRRDYGAGVAEDGVRAEYDAGSDRLRRTVATLAEKLTVGGNAAHPLILLAHCNVRGALTAGDEIMSGKEVELEPADLDPFSLAAFGHIHLHQQIGPRAWFVGTPLSQTHGETDPKGICCFDLDPTGRVDVLRIPTPAPRFVTVTARLVDGRWQGVAGELQDVAGAEVRLRLDVPEASAASYDPSELVALAEQCGAVAVQLDPRIEPSHAVRSTAVAEASTLAGKLEAYWSALGKSSPDAIDRTRLLDRLGELT